MTTKTLDLNNIERKIFWGLLLGILGVTLFYLSAVLSLTVAGVERDHLSRDAHNLSLAVGDLEAEYLTQSNSITLSRAHDLGFHEANAKFTNLSLITKSQEVTDKKISMMR